MDKLPPWPELPELFYADNCFPPHVQAKILYERASATAWEQRCRLAVEALQSISGNEEGGSDTRCANAALVAIGPLPPVTP